MPGIQIIGSWSLFRWIAPFRYLLPALKELQSRVTTTNKRPEVKIGTQSMSEERTKIIFLIIKVVDKNIKSI